MAAERSSRLLLLACAAPAAAFFAAFWLIPAARLLVLPGQQGLETYFAVLTSGRYLQSLFNTVLLSLAVTMATLVLGSAVGLYLGRRDFLGKKVLLSVLTLPLSESEPWLSLLVFIGEAARDANAYVVIGVCEKMPNTIGTMFNTQVYFGPDGRMIGKHQKIMPTVGERLVHMGGFGDTFGAFQTEFGPMSGLICRSWPP